MKKIYIFAAVLALLTLSLNAQMTKSLKKALNQPTSTEKVATTPDGIKKAPNRGVEQFTVCDGTATNSYLPFWGLYFDDNYQIDQMIYPESLLTGLVGKTITSITFYARDNISSNLNSGQFTFKIGTTNQTTFSTPITRITTGMTAVATGMTMSNCISGSEFKIDFSDNPFTYQGGNLVLDYQLTTRASGYNTTYFYGENNHTSASFYGRSTSTSTNSYGVYSNSTIANFLPKVSFTYEVSQHDLAIALDAQPATVVAGNNVTLTATVTNTGSYAENGYTVTFTDPNGNAIDTQTGTSLAVGASTTFTTTYTTTDAQGGTTVNFGASVACTDDAVATNNEATASTSVLACPPPENVQATGGQTGTITWDVPIIASSVTSVTEDFENGTGGWTFIDNDGDGYNWNWHQNTGTGNLTTNSGDCNVNSESYHNNETGTGGTALTPDNWLISPEAILDGTFSLYATGQDDGYYSEVFGVYVCVGSYNGVSDFLQHQVGADATTSYGMQQYNFDLSQYNGQAGHIAIRHYNVTDQFILDIDDITYKVSVPGEQPTSYNIYLDGQLVGNVLSTDALTYTFDNLSDGTYQCAVSAVYSYGESVAVPATFTIDTSNPTVEISPETQTISDAAAGTLTITGTDIDGNINVSAGNDWSLNPTSLGNTGGDVNVTYTGRALSASTTVTASATGATDATATVDYVADVYIVGNFGNSGWDFEHGTQMTYANGTYTTTLTASSGDYIVFARLLGNGVDWNTRYLFGPVATDNWWMQGDSNGGNLNLYDNRPIYFTEGGTYRITINANDNTFTITKLSGEQTAPPVITSSSDGEYVTITATGDGTVTLNVPGHDPVSGEGEVSITVPCGYASNTITVTATAKEDGKEESDPATAQINIPAGSDWVEMDGTYDDPNTLLSFLKGGEDIMMLDQFTASTLNNSHLASYIYTLREGQPGGEQKMSTPVPIPVYKTFSTMQGVYTKNQVDNDKNMKLKANVLNAEMDFDVAPDGNVLYYNLYRSNLNGDYPVIDDTHRVSKLQQFDEQVGDYSQFFLFESHTSGVIPRYDHFGNGIVERLDTNYVQGEEGNELSYVPVIWTLGINSARGDGKDNSYGSDIKRETMGNVTAKISGETTAGNTYGTWKVGETEYCVFHPTIEVTGILPQAPLYRVDYNDGDYAEYEPYMCRAWCTYEGIHDFIRNSEGNLQDAGALTTPYWLGDATFDNSLSATIGGDWTGGAVRDQWSFGLPSTTDPNEVTYIIRFYYKKVVTDAQNQQNGGSGAKVGGEDEVYFMTQTGGEYGEWVVGINELYTTIVPVDVTYVNPQGMKSSRPFDGVNIVVTRYSDGSTRTSKIIR